MDISGSGLRIYIMEKNSQVMNKESITIDISSFFLKHLTLLGLILLGLLGRFSYDLLRNKKFTAAYVLGCTGASFVIGCLAGNWAEVHYSDNATALTVLSTMLANNIVSAIMSIDYKALMQKNWKGAFEILTRKKD